MNKSFLIVNETLDLDNWDEADGYTKLMYSWLPELKSKIGKTYLLSNLHWPSDDLITVVPNGYDTYILTFQFEYPDFEWIKKFCSRFIDSQVLLIYPYSTCRYQIPNLRIIDYQGWPMVIDWYQKEFGWPDIDFNQKTKKISALTNRVNQGRMYICAYLHQHWNQENYVLSYHGMEGKQQDWYLLDYTGNQRIDNIIDYIKSSFMHLRIIPDSRVNLSPVDNLNYAWSAYSECLVNCTNESVNCSNVSDSILPGPYLTEKTIKCLLSKTAVLPVGQYQTYQYLENLGLQFEYPWDKTFDNECRDMVRFVKIFDALDYLDSLEVEEIKQSIKQSCEHNREYILSGDFLKTVTVKNESNIHQFYQS
jgi:hypothetical protein